MAITLIMALAFAGPDVAVRPQASARSSQHGRTSARSAPAGRGMKPKAKPQPHPHCEGELPKGQVASKSGPTWGAYCKVVYS